MTADRGHQEDGFNEERTAQMRGDQFRRIGDDTYGSYYRVGHEWLVLVWPRVRLDAGRNGSLGGEGWWFVRWITCLAIRCTDENLARAEAMRQWNLAQPERTSAVLSAIAAARNTRRRDREARKIARGEL